LDLVQYKLERLDERNSGLHGLLQRGLQHTPLLFCALGLIAGILIQNYTDLAIWPWLTILIFTLIIAFFIILRPIRHPAAAALLALAAFACLGALRLISASQISPYDISALAGDTPAIADLRGRIASDISIENRQNWAFGQFQYENLSSTFLLEIHEARCTTGWRQVTGTTRVRVAEPVYDLMPGDCVELYTTLSRFKPPMNPGTFDTKSYYARRGIHLAAFVESRAAILPWHPTPASRPVFATFQQWLRAAAHKKLRWGDIADDPGYGLLEALLLGRRADIDPETYEAFRRTGLLHYVSLSGMHIGIVIAAVWQLARIIGFTRRRRAVLCIGAITLFLTLVPAQSPILRAGVIGLAFCGAALARRQSQPVNTLSLAAIIILLFSPLELFFVGWQLSFACVLGILLISKRLEMSFYEAVSRVTRHNISPDDMGRGVYRRFLRGTVALMATGIAAWIGGSGLMLYHFHNATPLASVWTAVTSPLMAAIMVLGYLKIALSAVVPTLGEILAPVISALSSVFISLVKSMAKVSLSEIVMGHVAGWFVVLCYAAILYVVGIYWPAPRIKSRVNLALVIVLAAALVLLKWERAYPSGLELACLSVGHGQAIVARCGGDTVLFDCGSRSVKDCGRGVVTPFLRWCGTRRLDAVYLSHGDTDHCNGLPEVMAAYPPSAVFVADVFENELGKYGVDAVIRDLTAHIRRSTVAGDGMDCRRMRIRTLWPPAADAAGSLVDNDKSLAVLVEFMGRKILVSSDIERHAQQQILAMYPDLRVDVVIAPHHGSVKSRYKGFVDALQPEAVIYSCDEVQRARVMRANASPASAKAYFTGRDGAVTVHISKDGLISFRTHCAAHEKGHVDDVPFK